MSRININVNSFAEKLLKAVKGGKDIVEPTFIHLDGVPGGDEIKKATGCEFFSVPVTLGVSSSLSSFTMKH